MKRTGVIVVGLAISCVAAQAQQTTTIVSPGDTGSIVFPVAADTFGTSVEGVTVSVNVDPAMDFQVQPVSQLGPETISPGTTTQFQVKYFIGLNATSGTYTVTLHYSSTNPDVYPSPDDPTQDTSVRFQVTVGGPAVSMADVMYWGDTPNIYNEFQGNSTFHPTTVVPSFPFGFGPGLYIDVKDPSGISSLTADNNLTFDPPFTPGSTRYQGLLALPADAGGARPPLAPVLYTLTAENSIQKKSITPVQIAAMNAAISAFSGTLNENTGDYTWNITLNLTASLGLNRIERIARATLTEPNETLVEVKPLSTGSGTATFSKSGKVEAGGCGVLDAMIFDQDGNNVRFSYSVYPVDFDPGTHPWSSSVGPVVGTQFEKGDYTAYDVPLGAGVTIANLKTDGDWNVDLAIGPPVAAVSGWKAAGTASYFIVGLHPTASTPTISIPFSSANLTVGQKNYARLGRNTYGLERMGVDVMLATATDNSLKVASSLNGAYTPIAPIYENPAIASAEGGAEILYDASLGPVSLDLVAAGDILAADLRAQASLLGYNLQGSLFLAGPHGTVFNPPAYITLPGAEANHDGVLIVELSEGQAPRILPTTDRSNPAKITSQLDYMSSYFGLFTFTPPNGGGVGGNGSGDLTPPETTIGFSGAFVSTTGAAALINEQSSVTLTAVDSGAGQVQTFYAVDPSASLLAGGLTGDTTAAFLAYGAGFSLVPGRRVVAYGSVDGAGNYELLKSTVVIVEDSTLAAADATPPVTTLGFDGYASPADGAAAFIYQTSSVNFVSVEHGSGLAAIYYAIDPSGAVLTAGLSPETTASFLVYAQPFSLAPGSHVVAYGAADAAGNYETLRSTAVVVGLAPTGGGGTSSSGGMGIGKDPFDALWSVAAEGGALSFAKSNSDGGLLALAPLQDAAEGFPWSVLFDPAGRAYAIGDAAGAGTQGLDLAVYRASADGASIESRTLLDSGFANNDIVFDAKAPGWITGAAQTSGPVDLNAAGVSAYSMALWRFDPAQGTIQLKATYARAGFDLGAGLAVDPDGSVWIAGYSLTAAAPVVGGFDLALWHYAADGTTLLGGPFLIPGYLDNLDGGLTARVHADGQAVYVAAPRSNAAGGTDTAFLRFDKAAGRVTKESVWRPADGSPSYPIAVLPEAGGLLVAGGIGGRFTQAALWRFGFDGTPRGAATADAGGATGAVFRGADLWLTVEGSTSPYRVAAEAPAAGAFIDISTPSPSLTAIVVTPSTVSVAAGLTVQFAAAGTFTDGSTRTMTADVAWTTDAPSVATVSASGLATGFLEGTALVAASSGAISAQAILTVTPPVLVSISVEPALASIPAGTTIQFTAGGTFTDGSTRTLTNEVGWWTDVSSVSRINAVGLSTGAAEGVTRVIASSGSISGSAILTVTPPAIVSITVTPASATIVAETSVQFSAGGAFTDGSIRTITGEVAWTTESSSVALVSAGLATGQGAGTTRVVASLAAVTGAATLTVTAPPLTLASITPASGVSGENVPATVAGTGLDASTALTLERADALRGTWAATGSYGQARYLATLTKLRDGRVLLAGGNAGGSASSAADRYDPATGAWTAVAPMNRPRDQHGAVLLADGRVLVAGGYGSGAPVNTVEIYDPASGAWTLVEPMLAARAWPGLALLADGRVLAAGGVDAAGTGYLTSAEIYDPIARAWSPTSPMNHRRAGPATAALNGGKILVAGGWAADLTSEVYDPATGLWTAAAGALSAEGYLPHAVTLSNGKVMVVGDPGGTTDLYDPATNAMAGAARLGVARYVHEMVRIGGTALVIGGETMGGTALASTEVYDVAAGAWRPGPALTAPRTWLRGAVLDDGRVLVTSGLGAVGGAKLNTAEVLGAPAAVIAAAGEAAPDWRHLAATLDLTGAATGYWDVVVRRTDGQVGRLNDGFRVLPGAPVLASIGVTPLTATIVAGATVQFAAAGIFTDGSTRTMTGEVGWTTQFSTTAAVDPAGLAKGVKAGLTRVFASSGAITGTATLTVTAPPLTLASIIPASAPAEQTALVALTGTGFDAETALTLERGDALRGTWAATGSFGQARYLATLTKLRDGRVLLAGGNAGGSASSAADRYDPATGAWTAVAPMNRPRDQHGAVLLADGRVLVAGGYGSGAPVNTVEIYDPASGAWTLVEPMLAARAWPGLALLADGRVLAAGGVDAAGTGYLTSAEIYDPIARAWSPTSPMNHRRAGPATAALNGGKILVAGGWAADLTSEVYDPATGLWTAAAGALSAEGYLPHAVTLSNGKVMVVGDPGGTTDLYDPATNAMAGAARLGIARYVHEMVRVSGTALVIGGETMGGTALASTEVYDVAAGAWRPGPALMAPRTWLRGAVLDDGRVLVTSGLGAVGGAKLNTAEVLGAPAAVIAAAGEVAPDAKHLTGTLDLTGAATGYWDVVVRGPDGQSGRLNGGFEVLPAPPALASIAVTPSTATIMVGATIQFAAAGTYADGSTRTITREVTWTTDVPAIATVDGAGLATGVAGGTARVTASSGAFSAYATLGVAFVATTTTSVNGSPEVTLVSTAPFSVVAASTETGVGAVALGSATAQGLVLVSPVYQVTRQDPGATAVLTWSFDPALVDAATLAIWRFDGVAWSSVTVLNQVVIVSNGAGTVTGEVVLTSLFALFSRDTAAPVTTLLVDGAPAGAARLELAPASVIGFSAVDAGVGVARTLYALDGGAEAVFLSAFAPAPGNHLLSYRSVDRGGNEEAPRAVEVRVASPNADAEPPVVRLDYPGASALGVERAVGGIVGVRGSVSDASAVSWTLEAAPGEAAAEGFTTIASGAGSVSGSIAAWDTASLHGYRTLRLRASDASGNAASATAAVFVGAPVMTFAAGRKDSDAIVAALKGPAGIAVRADGAVWATSVENDQILLISPAGVLLGEAGRAPGRSGETEERGKKAKSGGPVVFKAPQGLALDAAGNLYVADRDTNRVAKLSPDGQSLLLEFGRSGNGGLKRPFDVAVDANGDVYAADSGHGRVAVFDAAGGYLRALGAGVLPAESELRGLALTAEGLWVSDRQLEVIHLFSRSGDLIRTIGGSDSSAGELSRTRGLAADSLGALYVVEPNRDRVQKFDPQGKGLLDFGTRERSSRADNPVKRRLTQPVDAAVGPDGSLWIADAGRDRIVRYSLPASGAGIAALSTGRGTLSFSSAEPARRVVDHEDGAEVSRDDGAGVRVPKGALHADLEITVDRGDESQDKESKEVKRRELKIKAVSEEIQYGPEGTTFDAPVILSLPYDANLITSLGMSENDLKVYYWNPGLKEWQAMPSTVDKKSRTVNALTTHFSAYQVGGAAGAGGIGVAAAVDDFGFRDQYAFPSPSRNGAPVTFRIQPGLADSVSVRVYDLSGRQVHDSADFRFAGAIDDGNGKGNQNTYDHAWSVDGVGSGVYRYVIEAKRAGQTPIVKSGKAGVIK